MSLRPVWIHGRTAEPCLGRACEAEEQRDPDHKKEGPGSTWTRGQAQPGSRDGYPPSWSPGLHLCNDGAGEAAASGAVK